MDGTSHVLQGVRDSTSNALRWLCGHKLPAAAAGAVAIVLGGLYWNGTFDRPDPQEQIGLRWLKPVGTESAYAGSAACQACHPTEFAHYSASPHSHTVHMIPPGQELPEFGSTQTVMDERSGVVYSVRKSGGKNEVVASAEGESEAATAQWIFGSGTHAQTYLAQDGNDFQQLRITYYPAVRTWNFTPGSALGAPFHQALGDDYSAGQAAACFGCHSTVLTGSRKALDLEHSHLNVGCESCHGPCRRHIESVNAGGAGGTQGTQDAIVMPPTYSGPQIMQLCGSCHRVPVDVKDQNAMGESLLPRFPGVALPRSRCFIASAGKLSCVTCHDPHRSTRQQQLTSFERKCLDCHSAPHGTTCPRGMKSGCVNCHMPAQFIARKLPLRFHNHWIRKNPFGVSRLSELPHHSAPAAIIR